MKEYPTTNRLLNDEVNLSEISLNNLFYLFDSMDNLNEDNFKLYGTIKID